MSQVKLPCKIFSVVFWGALVLVPIGFLGCALTSLF